MNPYENQVVQQSLNDVRQNVGAAALRGGAFGGSRHGVTEVDTMGDVAGRLRQSGFNTAVSNAMTDRSQRLGAANQLGGLANQAFNTGRTINQDMMQQGLLQQMLQQQLIDAAKSDFALHRKSCQQPNPNNCSIRRNASSTVKHNKTKPRHTWYSWRFAAFF